MKLRRFIISLFLLVPFVCMGQETDSLELAKQDSLAITESDDFVRASILVASPSNVLYSCVGHTSIRMQCPHYGLDVVYTYESESVENRVLSFFMGKLKMGMTAVPTERVLADYAKEGRGITEYVVNIPLEKRKQLWQYLDVKVEEGMNLPYDYLNRSCALACLRAIRDAVLPDTLCFGEWDERLVKKSRRALLGDRTEIFPWNRFVIFSITGTEADRACADIDKVVLPADLIEVLQKTRLDGQLVLGEANNVVRQTDSIRESSWLTPMLLSCIVLVFAIVSCFWMQHPLSVLLLVLQSVAGLAMSYLIVLSSLPNTSFSWLIIPFNLLPLLLWHWRRWWLLSFAVICLCWCLIMLTCIDNPLVDNAHIVLVLALAINYIGQWNQFRKIKNQL